METKDEYFTTPLGSVSTETVADPVTVTPCGHRDWTVNIAGRAICQCTKRSHADMIAAGIRALDQLTHDQVIMAAQADTIEKLATRRWFNLTGK